MDADLHYVAHGQGIISAKGIALSDIAQQRQKSCAEQSDDGADCEREREYGYSKDIEYQDGGNCVAKGARDDFWALAQHGAAADAPVVLALGIGGDKRRRHFLDAPSGPPRDDLEHDGDAKDIGPFENQVGERKISG